MSLASLFALLQPVIGPGSLIMADQNGPRPPKPYCTLRVRQGVSAPAVQLEANSAGIADFIQTVTRTVEVEAFGRDALQRAEMLAARLRTPSTTSRAVILGLGVSRINNAQNVPELMDQSIFEERAILEFTVYDSVVVSDDVGLIESTIIHGDAISDNMVSHVDIEVSKP